LYHALARGNEKSAIFLNDDDCGIFLELLNRVASRHRWRLWAYCLMPNHYHLLVETMEPTLARGMRDLNGSYAQLFNRSHDRVGHLFQGRYKSLLVDREAYLLEVARYIVLNPVRARLCSAPGDWRWSSYRASMETAVDGPALAAAELLALFSSNRAEARRRYATFVASGVNVPAPAWTTACGAFLGDDDFVAASVQQATTPSREVPRAHRAWRSLGHFERTLTSRNDAIRMAYASGTYTLAEIARHFGLHYATVSRIARSDRCGNTRPDPPNDLND
jgi:REP element-mobilizing transposase RayT